MNRKLTRALLRYNKNPSSDRRKKIFDELKIMKYKNAMVGTLNTSIVIPWSMFMEERINGKLYFIILSDKKFINAKKAKFQLIPFQSAIVQWLYGSCYEDSDYDGIIINPKTKAEIFIKSEELEQFVDERIIESYNKKLERSKSSFY